MLNGVNDEPETARELGELMRGRNMLVNLIPWNPVYSPGMQFEAPGTQRVRAAHPAASPATVTACSHGSILNLFKFGRAVIVYSAWHFLASCLRQSRLSMVHNHAF